MIRILLVEDQPEKKQRLVAFLCSQGLSIEEIEHVDNAFDAKRLLKRFRYDLLILDINIPKRADEGPTRNAGLDVMSFIRSNESSIPPKYIYGMTAYDDSFADASGDFDSALWKLVRYHPDNATWESSLSAAVSFLQSKDQPPYENDGRTFHRNVGIVVALEEELLPFRSLLSDFREISVRHDSARYFEGSVIAGSSAVSVVVSLCPRMGLPAAAVSATKLIQAFRPQLVICTGICAGVEGKTSLGDLILADPCFDWGSGKWVDDAGERKFLPAAYPWRLSESLRSLVRSLCDDGIVLNDAYRSFEGRRPENRPRLISDAVASGGSVLQSEDLMKQVVALHKNLVAIDMEIYSVLTAAEYGGDPQPKAMALKSVCDFGTKSKDDKFHEYASHVSAKVTIDIIKNFPLDALR